MKITTKKLEELRLNGYYVESINEPQPVPKPRGKKKTPKVKEELPAAPAADEDNGRLKEWNFDVVRDTSGFIVSVKATQLK